MRSGRRMTRDLTGHQTIDDHSANDHSAHDHTNHGHGGT